jgi:peptidoglycan/LPS O-acetylase OafA/YrhL
MKTNWPWWNWVLTAGGILAGACFVAAGLLALSGRPDQWITLALAGALIVIVVLQLEPQRNHKGGYL